MGRLRAKSDYEKLRNDRILEKKARLASLGLQKTISELRSITSSEKPDKTHVKKYSKVDYFSTPLRRSSRLKGKSGNSAPSLKGSTGLFEDGESEDDSGKRPANAPLLRLRNGYEKLRNDRILENKARLASLGLLKTISELRSITSSAKPDKTHLRKYFKVDYFSTPLRRSSRLKGKSGNSAPSLKGSTGLFEDGESEDDSGKRPANAPLLRLRNGYEKLRNDRILENKARLASLGLQKTISELRSITSSAKPDKTHVRKYSKVGYFSTPLRRSSRLKGKSGNSAPSLKGSTGGFEDIESEDDSGKRPANAPLLRVRNGSVSRLSPDALARRCTSKGRGSLYDPIYGICCHFCRQKKMCGEEDCKRCGNLDINQPCVGKTDCSACHSSTGVFCRACLKIRYGEDIDDVRTNKQWMCPHCIEEKGLKPYWICNSSLCLRKRKMEPTGIVIFKARKRGYESAAHLLMDKLRRADKGGL